VSESQKSRSFHSAVQLGSMVMMVMMAMMMMMMMMMSARLLERGGD